VLLKGKKEKREPPLFLIFPSTLVPRGGGEEGRGGGRRKKEFFCAPLPTGRDPLLGRGRKKKEKKEKKIVGCNILLKSHRSKLNDHRGK